MALNPPAVIEASPDAPEVPRAAARVSPGRSRLWIAPTIVGACTVIARLATAAAGPTDWDSAQYASAVGHYDVTHGQPQPPGYWLYVEAGRVLTHLGGFGTVRSLVVVAALASGLAAALTVVAGRDLGGPWVGVAAGAVVAASPFAWFSGSIVATYSFDLLACPLLMIFAWRARPDSWHGVAAAASFGFLAGFRQSIVQSFFLLVIIAVVASTRSWCRLAATVGATVAAVAVWFVPMILEQPGGFSTWAHATRIEANGAAQATSVLDHAPGGTTNLGTFAGTSVVALAPVALLALLAGAALLVRWAVRSRSSSIGQASVTGPDPDHGPAAQYRPWYQSRAAILGAALVPAVLLVALVQFAKSGYLLAYLPAAVIALLLPVGALTGTLPRGPGVRGTPSVPWSVLATLGVIAVVALGAQRFLGGDGVLPASWTRNSGALWLVQPRYQAPYAATRAAIRTADSIDAALIGLGPVVHSSRDVIVFDTTDGGGAIYRNAGWSLPSDRVALIVPGMLQYNELHGALYYASGSTIAVGPGGSVYLVASPGLAGLSTLAAEGSAQLVPTPEPIGYYRVFRVLPGASLLGVHIVTKAGPRPLGTGIAG
jgi:hypothetical protein